MGMVGGLDVHRAQITFDWVDHETGEVGRGRVAPATREQFRCWLELLPTREGAFAVEATTGWRFVVEELTRAGFEPHLAEPADTAAAGGRKRRAKTDRADAKHLHSSDGKRSPGHLARQGPPALRWALFEAAIWPTRPGRPHPTTTDAPAPVFGDV
jgi:transposase